MSDISAIYSFSMFLHHFHTHRKQCKNAHINIFRKNNKKNSMILSKTNITTDNRTLKTGKQISPKQAYCGIFDGNGASFGQKQDNEYSKEE